MEFTQIVERGRALAAHVQTIDRRWLLAGGAGLTIVVLVPVMWLLLASAETTNPTVAAEDLRMAVICGACGLRDSMPVGEIRALPVGDNGLMICPKCGKPELDRYRRGSPGILRVDVGDP